MASRLKKFFTYGIAAPSLITYGATYYYFPDLRSNQKELFKAFQRTLRVGVAGLKMTYIYKYDEGDMAEKHEKASLVLREAFLKNAGLYIKFGQLIASLDVIVPCEYRRHFELLCHDCPESSYENVKQAIEKHYGQNIEQIFSYFNPKPIKSASIGQVHEAVLKTTGERVAVKVMHDWLIQQSAGDLKMVETFVSIGEKIFPEFQFQWFAEECRFNLYKELDFKQEIQNSERCRKLLANHSHIRLPKNYLDMCNEKIIVMEWIDGIPIMDVETLRNSKLNLPQISKIISTAFCQMIYQDGFVHADPHQGNFIIRKREDGETEVILLDHGLYLNISQKTQLHYSQLWKAIITQDLKQMEQSAIDLGAGEYYQLFVSMVTSRRFDDVVQQENRDMKDRLRSPDDIHHRKQLANFGAQHHDKIIYLLHKMNSK